MVDSFLTGSRLRNRRIDRGLKQADLARTIGISASYLNLIEHNRRRIGGRLLHDLARALDIDAELLVEGTGGAMLAPLREAAAEFPSTDVEMGRAEDLIARYPGWAGLITAQRARIAQLDARIEALTNRLAHDTQISASLHEVISTATAIKSTASILVETPDLERDWQSRFHRNMDADSQRLADSSQVLLGLLDMEAEVAGQATSPVEQAEAAFAQVGFHLADIDAGKDAPVFEGVTDPLAQNILRGWTARYAQDAAALPYDLFVQAARQDAYDPARLAARFGVPMGNVLRRLAHLPAGQGHPPMGLAICDAAGVVTFQKPVLEFRLPRSGAACPLWPLYQALSQPGRALRRVVRLPEAARTAFECFAIAGPVGQVRFGEEPCINGTMMVRPAPQGAAPDTVGPGCRVCPVAACGSRRHPSMLRATALMPL